MTLLRGGTGKKFMLDNCGLAVAFKYMFLVGLPALPKTNPQNEVSRENSAN
jgi:hypothetical protein